MVRSRTHVLAGWLILHCILNFILVSAALASVEVKKCAGHSTCNVDCRILLTMKCTGGCKNAENCKDCGCIEVVDEPGGDPSDCNCALD